MLPPPLTPADAGRLHALVSAFVRKRIRPPADAEDVAQTILVKIHHRMATLRKPRRIEAWSYQIARNAIADYHRTRKARPLPAECPTARPPASNGVASCTRWPRPKAPNASPWNGGATTAAARLPATTSASKTATVEDSGSTAKASTAANSCNPAGSCTGCSHDVEANAAHAPSSSPLAGEDHFSSAARKMGEGSQRLHDHHHRRHVMAVLAVALEHAAKRHLRRCPCSKAR